MSNQDFQFENDEVRFRVDENIALLTFKKSIFEGLADLNKSGRILELLDWIEKDKVVRALLIVNEKEAYNEETYAKFMNRYFSTNLISATSMKPEAEKKILRARQMNAFRNFILKLVEYKKLTISALNCEVVTPFFGSSLATDYRFASADMRFVMAHVKYGLHPAGALPFFLPRYVSQSKASEMLLDCRTYHAEEAKQLELINFILPNDDFEEQCIKKAKSLIKIDDSVLRLTKKLMYNYTEDLEHYFKIESKLIGF